MRKVEYPEFAGTAGGTSRDDRRKFILEQLQQSGQVDVGDVARTFGVSPMTIRRDLSHLDAEGLVRRVHGGATERMPEARRAATMADEKLRIAKAVRELVQSGDTVGIDAGTTCTAVAGQLSTMDDIVAVSNSLHAAMKFQNSASSMIVLGGSLTSEGSLVNGGALESRRSIHVDKMILGCGGLSVTDGISYFDLAETAVRERFVQNSDVVIMAADHTKLDRRKPIVLGQLDILDVLVTTGEPSRELRAALTDASVEIIIV